MKGKGGLVIRTEQGNQGYFWNIYSGEITIDCNRPYSSRKKAKEAAEAFMNRCLYDYETWPEEYR